MKKRKYPLLVMGLALVLSACGLGGNQGDSGQSSESTDENVIQETVDQDYYRPAITEDGYYPPSKNRGVTLRLNSNVNIETFEEDLIRHSQEYYSPEDHYFMEGQYLEAETVNSWLERQSEDNPDGLNPEDNGETNPENRAPNYLNSILEQDYYTLNENGDYELAGISIGLAMNSVDYYPEYEYGPTLSQDIPRDELVEQGRQMANEVVNRMRSIEGLEQVPIMVGLYEQSASDDLAGGVYLTKGLANDGATEVSNWQDINETRLIFPLEGEDTAEGSTYQNFQSEVETFFPNLSGVTGRAHYVNDVMMNLDIDIMTQFYGQGEMIAFTQFLNQSATQHLPENANLTITVESLNGTEAFLERQANEEEFYVHVF